MSEKKNSAGYLELAVGRIYDNMVTYILQNTYRSRFSMKDRTIKHSISPNTKDVDEAY